MSPLHGTEDDPPLLSQCTPMLEQTGYRTRRNVTQPNTAMPVRIEQSRYIFDDINKARSNWTRSSHSVRSLVLRLLSLCLGGCESQGRLRTCRLFSGFLAPRADS